MPTEPTQLTFLANQCRLSKIDQDFPTANKFWTFIEPALTKQLYGIALTLDWNASNQLDLAQEATSAIWSKMETFDPLQSKNARCPFTSWAYMQGRFAMIEHLRKNGLSRIQSDHKKLIIEKLTSSYPKGPEPGTTWLDLAKEHLEELSSPPELTPMMIQNTLKAWSLLDAQDLEGVDQISSEIYNARYTLDEIELALEKLKPSYRKLFIQRHVQDMSYDDIASRHGVTVVYARQIVSKACQDLRSLLNQMK
jgi:RNA polymerase sigma factor (sigma-70 family)